MNRTLLFAICTLLGAIVGAILAVLANELFGVLGVICLMAVMIGLYLAVYVTGGDAL